VGGADRCGCVIRRRLHKHLHEVSVPREGAYEAVMACASIPTGEPGWSAAVGLSLPAPAALGDANRAGGDP